MKKLFSIICFYLFFISYSQRKITLFFDVNSSKLNTIEIKKFHDFIKTKDLKIIKVIGYCDLRSYETYVDTLALKRAEHVANFIRIFTSNKNFEIEYKGQNFKQDKLASLTRKVEIHFILENINLKKNRIDNEIMLQFKNAKKGDKIILKNLSFFDHSDELYPESIQVRDQLLQALIEIPKLKIEIHGHICCTKEKDEEKIALKRCIAIYNFLISNGIDKNRLTYKSFDGSQPLFPIPEKDEFQKKANRRVEIMIIEK